MPPTKGLTHLSSQNKQQESPKIPTQPRRTTTTTTKKTAPPPSTKSVAAQFRIYQLPSSLRGWAYDRDLEAPLRHLGLLDVARLQLSTAGPQPSLVSQLIASYDPKKRRSCVLGIRASVDRRSFLSAVSLLPTAQRGDLPPGVTRAAEQFINMCLRVQWRDTLPAVAAAMREVEAGAAQKVDWGKLMWDLVENEILELPKRDDKVSYFGIYLQRLILVQLPHLFKSDTFKAAPQAGAWANTPILRAGTKPMDEMQSSQLGAVMLNDDACVGNNVRQRVSSTLNDGKMDTDEHNNYTESQHRFQQGDQQKRARNSKNCGVVPTGSASAIPNSSHDIADIERELKNATSDELREAETLVQVVKLLQVELSPEAIMHMFD